MSNRIAVEIFSDRGDFDFDSDADFDEHDSSVLGNASLDVRPQSLQQGEQPWP
jgi:hypothetical protein